MTAIAVALVKAITNLDKNTEILYVHILHTILKNKKRFDLTSNDVINFNRK